MWFPNASDALFAVLRPKARKGRDRCCDGAISDSDWFDYVISKVGISLLKNDGELRSSRWFDYRLLDPAKATQLFNQEYIAAYRAEMRRRDDFYTWVDDEQYVALKSLKQRRELSDEVMKLGYKFPKGTKEDIFTGNKAFLNSIWSARQAADRLCMPYDLYCRSIMRETGSKNWKRLPTPTSMSKAEYVTMAATAWLRERKANVVYAKHKTYTNAEYAGLEHQDAYHEYLLGEAAARIHPQFSLATMIFKLQVLPEQKAIDRFGSELVARAANLFLN